MGEVRLGREQLVAARDLALALAQGKAHEPTAEEMVEALAEGPPGP